MLDICEIKSQLKAGLYNEMFEKDLNCDVAFAVNRSLSVLDAFSKHFENSKCSLFSSPGRTELAGNHTDHQGGCVLAAAVNLDMLCAASISENNCVCIYSDGFGEISVDLSYKNPVEEERGTAGALVRGMAMWFEARGYKVSGMNAYVVSDVPPGSGMSSSASFEVLIGTIFNSFFANGKFSQVDIAKAGLFAENIYFGKPCGLMDQIACSVGGLVAIDFANSDEPVVYPVEYDFYAKGYSLCLVSTGGSHDDLTDEYAEIIDEMKSVAVYFGKNKLSEINEKLVLDHIEVLRKLCGDRAFLRALNYFEENRRAKKTLDLLLNDDMEQYLALVNKSGCDSFMYLQNIYTSGSKKKQPMAVALKAAELALNGRGAIRVHGGGFEGTIQAYVPNEICSQFVEYMDGFIYPGCCKVLKTRKVGAVEIRPEM